MVAPVGAAVCSSVGAAVCSSVDAPVGAAVLRERGGLALAMRDGFGLLEFLLRRPGDVLTRTEILHGVWDAHYDGDSNVVEVYVRYLRRKIDKPFGRNAIETVRGVGYRLAGDGG